MKRKKNKKLRKPNILPKPPREEISERENEDAMLSEFSDDYNDFFVDESAEREAPAPEERPEERPEDRPDDVPRRPRDRRPTRPEKRTSARSSAPARKKPISPFRRKIRKILSFVAIITVVIVVGVVLSLTVLFKTQGYEVIGNTQYNESDIISECHIAKGTNIFLAPKKSAAEHIKECFPYFEDVKVGFKIPDTIKIEITEAVEGYLIKVSEKEYLLISTKGRILNRTDNKSKYDLPIFIGPKLTSGEIGDYVEYEDKTIVEIIENITQVFADNGYQGITEVDATNTADITFTYDDRIKVKLGIPEDISYKIRTAMTIITTKIDVVPGSKIRGTLDVSRCYDTKRSYFDEDKSIDVNATESPSASNGGGTVTDNSAGTGTDTGDGSYDASQDVTYDDGSYDWSQDTGDYDTGESYDTGTYDGGTYDDGSYDYGGYDYDSYDTGDGTYDGGDVPGNNAAEAW